ncbi:PRD domain-containing protein [Erysipelothrix sp. HDW6C]|uniref:BglG family transcription antiterminator LicT n=1 Tax=Erysipelothrix sp. HDW6C TaxID=2714930 RepID=UPI00140CB2AD|nr:PRD domain-containing protein [Erysipelothrix sp. HDW6C]QIK69561.1 PRD domain-containing protein [Erysipelothrix sp. HDW6C]
MRIEKILNNNVVIVKDDMGNEQIVMGRGLAYQRRVGEEIEDAIIDKVFTLTNQDASTKFQELIVDIPLDHIQLAEEVVSYAKSHLNKNLNEMIYISLVDHIYTSILRAQDGINIKNALLWDIRRFYCEEYKVGLHALDMIEERFGIRLLDDEAGFIALHIVNAELDDKSIQDMYQITKIMQEITNIVRYEFQIEFDEDSVYYYRFITHLKFFAQRLIGKNTYTGGNEEDLLFVIRNKYINSYQCTVKIGEFIEKRYNYGLSDEEMVYLTIHIERVIYKTQ